MSAVVESGAEDVIVVAAKNDAAVVDESPAKEGGAEEAMAAESQTVAESVVESPVNGENGENKEISAKSDEVAETQAAGTEEAKVAGAKTTPAAKPKVTGKTPVPNAAAKAGPGKKAGSNFVKLSGAALRRRKALLIQGYNKDDATKFAETRETFLKAKEKGPAYKKAPQVKTQQKKRETVPPTLEELEDYLNKHIDTTERREKLSGAGQKRLRVLLRKGYSFEEARELAKKSIVDVPRKTERDAKMRATQLKTKHPLERRGITKPNGPIVSAKVRGVVNEKSMNVPPRAVKQPAAVANETEQSVNPVKPLNRLSGAGQKRFKILLSKGFSVEEASVLAKRPLNTLIEKLGNGYGNVAAAPRAGGARQVGAVVHNTERPDNKQSPYFWQRPEREEGATKPYQPNKERMQGGKPNSNPPVADKGRFRPYVDKRTNVQGSNMNAHTKKNPDGGPQRRQNYDNSSNRDNNRYPVRQQQQQQQQDSSYWGRADRKNMPSNERRPMGGGFNEGNANPSRELLGLLLEKGLNLAGFNGGDSMNFGNRTNQGYQQNQPNQISNVNDNGGMRGRSDTWVQGGQRQQFSNTYWNGTDNVKPRTPPPPSFNTQMRSEPFSNFNETNVRSSFNNSGPNVEQQRIHSLISQSLNANAMQSNAPLGSIGADKSMELSMFNRNRGGPSGTSFNSSDQSSTSFQKSWSTNQYQNRGESNYQRSPVCVGYFPCNGSTPTGTILRGIKSQNNGLPSDQWKILNRAQLSSGVELTFEIDGQSRSYLQSSNRIVRFNEGLVQLNVRN